jgi:predicted ATP-dependent endonuclease of OLD family
MRITHLYIKNYKNLKDFTWELSPHSPVITIVGKNASGKSNLLSAIVHIFGRCNTFLGGKAVRGKTIKDFEFSITYQTEFRGNNTSITFKYEDEKYALYQNNDPLDALQDEGVLPARIFVYYAGESKALSNIIHEHSAWSLFTYLFEWDNQFMLLTLFASNLSSIKEGILADKMNLLNFLSCKITIKK